MTARCTHFVTVLILSLFSQNFSYKLNEEWSTPQRVVLSGFTWNGSQAMEPFMSRDGRWVFWNSRNVGTNVSLYYGKFISETQVQFVGEIGGQANGPVPHLDAVPSMDINNNFFWVSTRDYPQNNQNLQTGIFDPTTGSIPKANHVVGNFYHSNTQCCWITMDQEVNIDGTILFFVNAYFPFPPGPAPSFTNISLAIKNPDGTWSEHPRAHDIMLSVNNVVAPDKLRYAPSSFGKDALELYFTAQVPEIVTTGIFVAKRATADDVFGEPERVTWTDSSIYVAPEAPTISPDGNLLMFNRIDCDTLGCTNTNIYSMKRVQKEF